MSQRYSQEFHDFIREYIPGHTSAEVSDAVKARFGIEITTSQVGAYKRNHKIRSNTPSGVPKGTPSKLFPAEAVAYIQENYIGTGYNDMAERLNAKFGANYTAAQIKSFYCNHRLNSGLTGRFEKGHVPAMKSRKMKLHPNSIATQFKPGHVSWKTQPVGTLSARANGYLYRKIGPNPTDWTFEHIRVWQEANGPVPKGCCVIFLDGNQHNCNLSNLALISRGEQAMLNRHGLISSAASITEANIAVTRLRLSIIGAARRLRNAQNRRNTHD